MPCGQRAPRGLPLTVHTDSQSLPQLVALGAATRTDLSGIVRKIRQAAERRGMALTCRWHSRDTLEAGRAHALALAGRERGRLPGADDARLWVEGTGERVEVGAQLVIPRTTRRRLTRWESPQALEDVAEVLRLLGARTVVLEICGDGMDPAVAGVRAQAARLGLVLK